MYYIVNAVIFLLRYVFAALGGLLMDRAARRFLPAGKGLVRRVIPVIMFFIAGDNKSWIGDENPLYLFPFFIATFLLCYGGPWYARLVTGGFFYALLEPLFMMVDSINQSLIHSIPHQTVTAGIKLVLCLLLWLLIRRITPGVGKLRLSGRLWALLGGLLLAPLFVSLSFSIWDEGGFDYDSYFFIIQRLAYTVLPFVSLSALASLVALVVLARHEELEQAKRLGEVQAVYYQSLQREQAGVRTLKHDLHNHVAAVQSLLEQGKQKEAEQYLASLSRSPALAPSVRICENEVANAVLGSKAAIMRENNLQTDWEVALPAALPLSQVDLCALLGNTLDNAIEAAAQAEDKHILMRARADKGMLMLRVENAYNALIPTGDGAFATTKKDKRTHGLGLAGIREIVERNGGSLEVQARNGTFSLLACIPFEQAPE